MASIWNVFIKFRWHDDQCDHANRPNVGNYQKICILKMCLPLMKGTRISHVKFSIYTYNSPLNLTHKIVHEERKMSLDFFPDVESTNILLLLLKNNIYYLLNYISMLEYCNSYYQNVKLQELRCRFKLEKNSSIYVSYARHHNPLLNTNHT